jgi:hypothetical protein
MYREHILINTNPSTAAPPVWWSWRELRRLPASSAPCRSKTAGPRAPRAWMDKVLYIYIYIYIYGAENAEDNFRVYGLGFMV